MMFGFVLLRIVNGWIVEFPGVFKIQMQGKRTDQECYKIDE